jgi:hypothetical protein
MKVFSIRTWQDDADEAVKSYWAYVARIRSRLPSDLQRIAGAGGDITLNDSAVERIDISVGDATAEIRLSGKWVEGSVVGSRLLRLCYRGVSHVSSSVDPDVDGSGWAGYGDHGFDEVELLGGGLYEHRMLFSSGIELDIRFSEFSLTYEDVPNRWLPPAETPEQ